MLRGHLVERSLRVADKTSNYIGVRRDRTQPRPSLSPARASLPALLQRIGISTVMHLQKIVNKSIKIFITIKNQSWTMLNPRWDMQLTFSSSLQ
jgi:hypothetical protein